MAETKQLVTFRIEPEMAIKISRLAKGKKISQGEVVRQLLEIGFEKTDHEEMVDKFENLQKKISDLSSRVKQLFLKNHE